QEVGDLLQQGGDPLVGHRGMGRRRRLAGRVARDRGGHRPSPPKGVALGGRPADPPAEAPSAGVVPRAVPPPPPAAPAAPVPPGRPLSSRLRRSHSRSSMPSTRWYWSSSLLSSLARLMAARTAMRVMPSRGWRL